MEPAADFTATGTRRFLSYVRRGVCPRTVGSMAGVVENAHRCHVTGQQQRLSIVRALAPRPRMLVLDEPIASIDPGTRLAMIDELLAQQRDRKLTTIVSSHITGDLRRFCSPF
jgi:ABC-type dipeptide/oligopeptide/nickel transport system ATPase subunit